ncbi:hypothetical protein CEXT_753701 [Caerostris extrusa]|uniref:Uncharacterized protein n=1 Tax=Caerostris extrusa TaxID=172846 RepID=A0AAV4MYW2_CAEEX|nr:hypothetical protein CEXT_753701 [Caerostris extrusa]
MNDFNQISAVLSLRKSSLLHSTLLLQIGFKTETNHAEIGNSKNGVEARFGHPQQRLQSTTSHWRMSV